MRGDRIGLIGRRRGKTTLLGCCWAAGATEGRCARRQRAGRLLRQHASSSIPIARRRHHRRRQRHRDGERQAASRPRIPPDFLFSPSARDRRCARCPAASAIACCLRGSSRGLRTCWGWTSDQRSRSRNAGAPRATTRRWQGTLLSSVTIGASWTTSSRVVCFRGRREGRGVRRRFEDSFGNGSGGVQNLSGATKKPSGDAKTSRGKRLQEETFVQRRTGNAERQSHPRAEDEQKRPRRNSPIPNSTRRRSEIQAAVDRTAQIDRELHEALSRWDVLDSIISVC